MWIPSPIKPCHDPNETNRTTQTITNNPRKPNSDRRNTSTDHMYAVHLRRSHLRIVAASKLASIRTPNQPSRHSQLNPINPPPCYRAPHFVRLITLYSCISAPYLVPTPMQLIILYSCISLPCVPCISSFVAYRIIMLSTCLRRRASRSNRSRRLRS